MIRGIEQEFEVNEWRTTVRVIRLHGVMDEATLMNTGGRANKNYSLPQFPRYRIRVHNSTVAGPEGDGGWHVPIQQLPAAKRISKLPKKIFGPATAAN
jgi:hypothetical protein